MLAPALLLTITFFALNAQSQCTQYQGRCQADWMNQLSSVVKQRPITRLKLMQSHDSGSYQLLLNATTPMEHFGLLDNAIELAEQEPEVKKFLEQTTLCHSNNIYQQLEQGIRSLDLRVLYNSDLDDFFLSHSFATISLNSTLAQIQQFMNEHSGEILLIQMQNDYEHVEQTQPHNDQIVSIVQSALQSLLLPVSANKMLNDTITLRNMLNLNQRILFGFSSALNNIYNNIWNGNIFNSFWPNQSNATKSLNTIENNLAPYTTHQESSLNSIFFTVTPDQNSILIGLMGSTFCPEQGVPDSIADWANQMNNISSIFIGNNTNSLEGLNIVSVDFPTDDYVQQIIHLNN